MKEEVSDKLRPMEKVIGVRTENKTAGYPYSVTEEKRVLHDEVGGKPIVIFHLEGMASALDNRRIHNSRDDGATGVFSPFLNGELIEFEFVNGEIRDKETGSRWNIAGKAVSGPLEGEQLETVLFGDYFAFAWLVFYPDTRIFGK